jgi:hypothetical protein
MHNKTLGLWALLAALASPAVATPMGTEFTYQGRLCDGGVPANGLYDLTFELYNAPDPPGGFIDSRTLTAVFVTNGLFTTNIDFGITPFAGEARWLKIWARTNGLGAYAELGPRQELQPTPYALYAASAATAATATTATAVPWGGITGVPTGLNDGDNDTTYSAGEGLTLVGTIFSVNTNFLNGRYWALAGNAGTTAGTHFVGTTDDEALELKVNRVRALRLDPASDGLGRVHPNLNGGAPDNSILFSHGSSIGGGWSNTITNAPAAFLGGGEINAIRNSEQASIGGGTGNDIQASRGATIGGGANNDIGTDSIYSFVGGGAGNAIATNAMHASIAGGYRNAIGATAQRSFIGGGSNNAIRASAMYASIAGGAGNAIGTNADYSFIGGGYYNDIGADSYSASIAGGYDNDIGTNSDYSFIGGGYNNAIAPNTSYASIAGGSGNDMGTNTDYSFIGGGSDNDIAPNSSYASITGGYGNDIGTNSDYSFVGGGYDNNIKAEVVRGVISGGYQNTIETNADYATIPGGKQAKAADYGQYAYASGQFAAQGDAQASMFVLRRTTTSATPTELLLDNSSAHITVPTNSTWAFDILVVGRSQPGGDFSEAVSVGYQLRGVVEREGSGTVVRYVAKTWSWETEAPALDATVEADADNHLNVIVTGAAYSLRWVAHVRTVEVAYP